MVFETPFTVRSYELDSLGHVNNAVFLSYLEEATFLLLAEHGLPFQDFSGKGWVPILAHVDIDFRQEITAGEQLLVQVWPISYGNTSMKIGYRLRRARDGSLVAEAMRVWVFVHRNQGKIPVPEEIRAAFGEPLAGEQGPAS